MKESNHIRKFAKAAFLVSVLMGILFIASSRAGNKKDGWKTYRDKVRKFEIKYPAKLIRLSKGDQELRLLHSIPFEHPNPCDFDDNPDPALAELTDFSVGIEVVSRDLRGAVVLYEGSAAEYVLARFTSDSVLKIEPGYIDTVRIGLLYGYRISQGVEGCGRFTYYFILDSVNTLVVTRAYTTELMYSSSKDKYLNLQGAIPPKEENELFNRILSSFKFRE